MGNVCIKNKGRIENIECERCGIEFQGKVGVVTFRGLKHPPKYCDVCNKKRKLIMLASLDNI